MDYAGNKELLETINDIESKYDFSIWNSYKTILKFSKHILDGLDFLHKKKICHLDIKPENIIVNTYKKTYKIIDFGFSSEEPFDDFVKHTRGTPGYFPKYFETEKPTPWLPKVDANDMIYDNNILFHIDRRLVYKIDSYCLGRVLYMLRYIYNDNRIYMCFNTEKKNKKKLNEIIDSLVENDANKRMTINQCLEEYF
jgi:serine/threonine protein kinase